MKDTKTAVLYTPEITLNSSEKEELIELEVRISAIAREFEDLRRTINNTHLACRFTTRIDYLADCLNMQATTLTETTLDYFSNNQNRRRR
ncbi:MAG: hypothetical protein GY721_01485 [Deltaproteobacteria bacterium]|nr:hypothetical protein [Deltaproteobacteria bacterium]